MAPLTWRNVDAPDLSNAANMMARATAGITGAFKAGGDIGRGIYDDQVEIGSRDAMRAAQQFTTSADWTNALQNGTAYGNMDPRFINAETLAWGADRRRGLLGEEQIVQNMEIQRQQEARAAAAAAQRAAGGGLGGGGGGGRRSGSGGTDADAFAVAQAEANRRVAVAQYGENSPEAKAATDALAAISVAAKSRTGILDAADATAGAIAADRAETAAIGDAAVAASSGEGGFNPYAIPFEGASPTAALPGSSVTVSTSGSDAPLPVPNATAPGGPSTSTVPPPAPAASPVASAAVNWGLNMGTPVDAPTASAVVAADAPASVDRPTLSFGSAVPPAELGPVEPDRPVSWSQYAQEALASGSTSGSGPSAVSMGMPAAVEETPQWAAYQAEVAAFEQSDAERTRAAEAEAARVEPNTPVVVKSNFDTSRATIDRIVEQNPEFALNEHTRDFRSTYDTKGPEAVAAAVATRLGMSSSDGLSRTITEMARDNGVDFATAAGAMVTAGGPANFDGNDSWFNPADWLQSTQYYDPDKAQEYMGIARSSATDPRGRIGQRNELGAIRSELTGIETAYASRREAEVRARAIAEARPNDPQAQRAYAEARAATLEADKAAVAFRRGLNERLSSIGMTKGVGARPKVDDYITPEMRKEATALEAERVATRAANVETFGVENPTYIGFRNGGFDPGNVPSNSAFGLRQANAYLPAIMSGRANDGERESFFNWVSSSPEARREIFGRIQEMEYNGEDVDLPEEVNRAYSQYTRSNIPEQAIADMTSLGFDLSGDTRRAAAIMGRPEVQEAMAAWRNAQSFFTMESTRMAATEHAKRALREAIRGAPDLGQDTAQPFLLPERGPINLRTRREEDEG